MCNRLLLPPIEIEFSLESVIPSVVVLAALRAAARFFGLI